MFQSRNLRNALLTLLLMLVSLGLVYVMSLTTALSFTGQPSLRNAGSRNKLLSETVGVFVEARPLSNMIPVLLYFAGYLGPTWPIHVFHSLENAPLLNSSSAISAHVARGSIILHLLPEGTALTSHDAVSQFLTSTWIWTTLLPATHALLFQADSILCGASMLRPENFLQYAFVGAPIDPKFGTGYNGGLSLRHIPTMLRAISTFKWSDTRLFEDQWFAKAIPKLTDPPAPPLPTTEEARLFSVETIWADQPMGYHQAKRWNAARMPEIIRWCPEITLAGEDCYYTTRLIYGDGSNTPRFIYGIDVADAIEVILHKGDTGETYNIGTSFEISNLNLTKLLIKQMGLAARESELIEYVEDRPFNDTGYAIDGRKLEALGWAPKVAFEDGLRKSIAWYTQYCRSWWPNISNALVAHPDKEWSSA